MDYNFPDEKSTQKWRFQLQSAGTALLNFREVTVLLVFKFQNTKAKHHCIPSLRDSRKEPTGSFNRRLQKLLIYVLTLILFTQPSSRDSNPARSLRLLPTLFLARSLTDSTWRGAKLLPLWEIINIEIDRPSRTEKFPKYIQAGKLLYVNRPWMRKTYLQCKLYKYLYLCRAPNAFSICCILSASNLFLTVIMFDSS